MCPRRLTDRPRACGACNVGSIPAEGTNERSEVYAREENKISDKVGVALFPPGILYFRVN